LLEARNLLSGTWTQLTNLVPSDTGTGTMMLLSDGTVMVQGGGVAKTWYQLTSDASGSYVNGTWSQLPSMGLEREFYASNVLPDGRVLVLGGENSGSQGLQNWTNTGEIYDPVANTWTNITDFPQTMYGDDPTQVLPDGRVLAGYLLDPRTYIYDPASDSWTMAGTKLNADRSDEETWVKLADDSILSYDVFNSLFGAHSQRYIPSQDQWVDAGTVPVLLSSSTVGYELGPAFLLPDGRAFYFGATGHTAYYDLTTNSWTAGPDIPNGLVADDDPAAMMPNGHILVAVDSLPLFTGPTVLYDFDPTTNTFTDVTPANYDLHLGANFARMLMLPTGQVLFTTSSDQLIVYTPDGSPDPSWQPAVLRLRDNGDGTFSVAGLQLNGLSEGASYGDDAEMSSNYPIVRLDDGNGNVFYARTYNWNNTGVATGNTIVATKFTLPAGINPGEYALSVVANGIASDPVPFTVSGPAAQRTHGSGVSGQALIAATPVTGILPLSAPAPLNPGAGTEIGSSFGAGVAPATGKNAVPADSQAGNADVHFLALPVNADGSIPASLVTDRAPETDLGGFDSDVAPGHLF
jgi:hypothetical protein